MTFCISLIRDHWPVQNPLSRALSREAPMNLNQPGTGKYARGLKSLTGLWPGLHLVLKDVFSFHGLWANVSFPADL